ncbi:MAG: hypothetical protein ACFB0B_10700 [Thermonemataceae bacterium]
MALQLFHLDKTTRKYMLEELVYDMMNAKVYYSARLTNLGINKYLLLLRQACESGDEKTLARELAQTGLMKRKEKRRHRSGAFIEVKVPKNACELLADGEFNKLYIRGLCRVAIEEGKAIEVYRAKNADFPREQSNAVIGKRLDPEQLLEALRNQNYLATFLGIHPSVNVGLSIRLVKETKYLQAS